MRVAKMKTAAQKMYVMLVGVNEFKLKPGIFDLEGCVNDAISMEKVFKERYGVPNKNIHVLHDKAATREAVLHGFRGHLIDNASKWAAANDGSPSPAFVYFFAGHGSTCRTPVANVFDETTLPYDSRTGDVYDIRDWELGQLVDELTQFTDNVTIILDCCKSGSGTRDSDEFGAVRFVEPDLREPNTQRPNSELSVDGSSSTRGVTDGGDLDRAADNDRTVSNLVPVKGAAGRHVLMAACRNDQVAKERTISEGVEQGAFTYFLARELMNLPAGQPITYRQLHERVNFEVNSRYASQNPQCEGDRDRLLFQLERPPIDPLFRVTKVDGSKVNVACGMVHGLTKGSELSVYAPGTLSLDEGAESLGSLRVQSVGSLECTCTVDGTIPNLKRLAMAAIETVNYGDSRQRVAIAIDDESIRVAARNRLEQSDVSKSLQLLSDGDAEQAVPFFVIKETQRHFEICDVSGERLVAPCPIQDPDKLAANLMSLTRYFNALHIRNRDPRSRLNGKVKLEIYGIDESIPIPDGTVRRSEEAMRPLPTTADGLPIAEEGTLLAFKIINLSDEQVYCDVVNFSYDYAITPLCYELSGRMPGTNRKIGTKSNSSDVTVRHYEWIGDHVDEEIRFVPADVGFVEGREFMKVIATRNHAADLAVLRQAALEAPESWTPPELTRNTNATSLDGLLLQTMQASQSRVSVSSRKPADDWCTATLGFVVTRSSATK